jgi:hypothetical protein
LKKKLPWILLGISAALLIAGLAVGEYRSVLEKAATVCLSCIGIG